MLKCFLVFLGYSVLGMEAEGGPGLVSLHLNVEQSLQLLGGHFKPSKTVCILLGEYEWVPGQFVPMVDIHVDMKMN